MRVIRLAILLGFLLGAAAIVDTLHTEFGLFGQTYEYRLAADVNFDSAEKFRVALAQGEKHDTILIRIESPGGSVLALKKMTYYMTNADARIDCITDSYSASAAATLLLKCDRIKATPDSLIVFHVYQICQQRGISGKCIKYKAVSPTFHPEYYKESMRELEIAKGVLTEEQWKALAAGKDVIITGKQLMKRLPEHRKIKNNYK